MPEKKHRNPFEEHIESDSFDVSQLGKASRRSKIEIEIEDFLNELPQPIDYSLPYTILNARQQDMCSHLSAEMVARLLRTRHQEALGHLNDEQLREILAVPIAVAMLAEEKLNPQAIQAQVVPERTHPFQEDLGTLDLQPGWGLLLENMAMRVRVFFSRIFKKRPY